MSTQFIRPKNAARKAGISVSHMYALINQGKFPSQVKLSPNISAFIEKEIDDWILERIKDHRKENLK